MTAVDAVNADRRLVLLRLLVDYRGTLNSSVLESSLRAFGHQYIDRAMVADDIAWLAARKAVTTEDLGHGVLVVHITPKGERIAAGHEWVTGIARPTPR
jgi:hypothetical protein